MKLRFRPSLPNSGLDAGLKGELSPENLHTTFFKKNINTIGAAQKSDF